MSPQMLQQIIFFLMFIPILSFHEAAHAWAAHKLGDDTARNRGRLTLNPISHIDPIGTLLIPLMSLFMGGIALIGWGRPVPIDANNFRSWRRDEVLVALAGPASNIVLAALVLLIGRWLPHGDILRAQAFNFAFLSVFLAIFNLMPIPPLDGWYPIKNAFRLPEDLVYRGGFWWLIILLVLVNLPPVMHLIMNVTSHILAILCQITFF